MWAIILNNFTMVITVIIAVCLLISYIVTAISVFKKVPVSISDTFYMYASKKAQLGYVFTLWMIAESSLMVIPMLSLCETEWWRFLGFLCPVFIAFCGCAPLFKENMSAKVHYTGAIGSVITGLAWCLLLNWLDTWVMLSLLGCTVFIIGNETETLHKCRTFWLEIVGFGTVALVLLVESLIYF